MFDLIVSGPQPEQRQRFRLNPGRPVTIGRTREADYCVAWEPWLSHRHATLAIEDGAVLLTRHPEAANPVFHQGLICDRATLHEGDCFVIGATVFRIAGEAVGDSSSPAAGLEEVRFEPGQLRHVRFSDADKRIEVLTHLPSVITGARTDEEFYLRIVQLLLVGIPRAEGVAIVEASGEGVKVLNWDRRTETQGAIRPSMRLVREAVLSGERSVLHVWESERSVDSRYTATAGFNWAFCVPVLIPGQPKRGLYVAGQQELASAGEAVRGPGVLLQSDVRFTELVAEIVTSLRRLSLLERHQAGLRQFFAPTLLNALGEDLNTDILAPRECEVTVLFCDLRGFSQRAEHSADDLTSLLGRVSQALGLMTAQILQFGGVTGDFQGDAALGFWGWPFPDEEATLNACRAALGIRAAFEQASSVPGHPLSDFQMGIGIAHGRAVAGKIGTAEQVKVTVFGPVVNLASRLESMTSQLRVPILLDEATASLVRSKLDPKQGRTRRLGRVLPMGLETPVMVSELLPSAERFPLLSDQHIAQYERGVDHFIAGDWESAWQCLHDMPAGDRAQDFLAMPIVQNGRRAPADWDGVIRMNRK